MTGFTPSYGQESKRDHRRLPGFYIGKVEYNLDPEKNGKIKVRVAGIDPPVEKCHTRQLIWARPSFLGAAQDMGTFSVPRVGSWVWIGYEGGFYDRPIYFGSYYGKLSEAPRYDRNEQHFPEPEITMLPETREVSRNGTDNWTGESGNEVPSEVWDAEKPHDLEPVCHVHHKTAKGHTFLSNDGDEGEEWRLIDRFGQFMESVCKVIKDENRYNKTRRGTKTAHKEPFDLDKLVDETAWVKIMNASRSMLHLEAKKDKERIVLRVSDKDQRRVMEIRMDDTKNQEKIEIYGLDKLHKVIIDCSKGAEKILIVDKAMSTFLMDSNTGILTVKGSTMTNVG